MLLFFMSFIMQILYTIVQRNLYLSVWPLVPGGTPHCPLIVCRDASDAIC